ncbi:MAG TPA: hypothetical protein VFN97_02350 [Actinospica sp.]|nr:hypothetical protein [Actinospica sp.]
MTPYEIRVDGTMAETVLHEAFPELDGILVAKQTILFGQIVDEAHLYGLLARFRALGLHVAELRRLPG